MTKFLTAINRKVICSVCGQAIYKYQEHFADTDEGYEDRDRWHKKCDGVKQGKEGNMKMARVIILLIICLSVTCMSYAQTSNNIPIHGHRHNQHRQSQQMQNNQQITQTINNGNQTIVVPLDDVFKYCRDGEDVYQRNIGRR